MSYWRERRVIELYKKSQGKPYRDIPEELVTLEEQRLQAAWDIDVLKKQRADEVKIGEAAVRLANIEARMRKVMAELKLA